LFFSWFSCNHLKQEDCIKQESGGQLLFREGLPLSLAFTIVPNKKFSIGPVTKREGELGMAAELQCGSTTVLGIEVTSLLAVHISAVTHTA
jgi:hypothetical protein